MLKYQFGSDPGKSWVSTMLHQQEVCYLLCVCVCRFLGLMVVFVCGALLCFVLTIVVLRRRARHEETQPGTKAEYKLVNEQKTPENTSSKEKEMMGIKT